MKTKSISDIDFDIQKSKKLLRFHNKQVNNLNLIIEKLMIRKYELYFDGLEYNEDYFVLMLKSLNSINNKFHHDGNLLPDDVSYQIYVLINIILQNSNNRKK